MYTPVRTCQRLVHHSRTMAPPSCGPIEMSLGEELRAPPPSLVSPPWWLPVGVYGLCTVACGHGAVLTFDALPDCLGQGDLIGPVGVGEVHPGRLGGHGCGGAVGFRE